MINLPCVCPCIRHLLRTPQEGAEFGAAMLKLTAPGVRDKMSAAAKKRVKVSDFGHVVVAPEDVC